MRDRARTGSLLRLSRKIERNAGGGNVYVNGQAFGVCDFCFWVRCSGFGRPGRRQDNDRVRHPLTRRPLYPADHRRRSGGGQRSRRHAQGGAAARRRAGRPAQARAEHRQCGSGGDRDFGPRRFDGGQPQRHHRERRSGGSVQSLERGGESPMSARSRPRAAVSSAR